MDDVAGRIRGAAPEQDEVKTIVESTREAIVVAPLQE
jgi:hypothetical protein